MASARKLDWKKKAAKKAPERRQTVTQFKVKKTLRKRFEKGFVDKVTERQR